MAADTIDITWTDGGAATLLSHEGPYRVALITGWEDLPAGRVDDQARANAHGSHDAIVYAAARTVTVEGYCFSVEERDALLAGLGAAERFTARPTPGVLEVTLAGRTLHAGARLTRGSKSLRNWGVGHFGWQLEFWCPDPRRYGPVRTGVTALPSDSGGMAFPLFNTSGVIDFGGLAVPGQVTLDNDGTADSWPAFEVTGPLAGGFELIELVTGRRLRWENTVPAGVAVALDSATGAVTYDGAPGYEGELTARDWWPVPADSTRTVQINPLGAPDPAAQLLATWAPAYW